MHHHFGFIVFLSVCGETPCCVGGGQSFLAVYLLHAWTVWKLCVGQTPAEAGSWNYCLRCMLQQHHLMLNAQVLHHYLCELLSSFMDRIKARSGSFISTMARESWVWKKNKKFETCFQLCCCSLLLQMTLNPMIIFCPVLNGFCVSTKTQHVTGFPE